MKVIEIPQLLPSGGRLTGYLHEPDDFFIHRGRRPAVVVIPGGGYQKLAERETDPVAFEFFSAGFNTFILHQKGARRTGQRFISLVLCSFCPCRC